MEGELYLIWKRGTSTPIGTPVALKRSNPAIFRRKRLGFRVEWITIW